MSGLIGENNCQICIACHNNCSACPAHQCQRRTMYFNNLDRINKQVRISSSLSLLKRRTLNVSRQVGQSANPRFLGQAGGPGDLIHAIQKTNGCDLGDCKLVTYRVPIARTRTANKGGVGVDKKHDSYARYLARRVGGELRKERIPRVRNNTTFIHQPRNRTGTAAACLGSLGCKSVTQYAPPSKMFMRSRTAFKCNDVESQQAAVASQAPDVLEVHDNIYPMWATPETGIEPLFGPNHLVGDDDNCCSNKCCDNRIPGGPTMGEYEFKCECTDDGNCYNCSRNNKSKNVSGLLGNNTQGVPSGNCSCCRPLADRIAQALN